MTKLSKHSLSSRKRQLGQGMTEYIIIVALIALAAIAAFGYFGQAIRGQTAQMAHQVAGDGNNQGVVKAEEGATAAQVEADDAIGLNDYNDHGDQKLGGG